MGSDFGDDELENVDGKEEELHKTEEAEDEGLRTIHEE